MRAQSRSFHESSGERDNESFKEILWKDKSLEIFGKSNWEDLDEWIKREDEPKMTLIFHAGGWRFLKHRSGVQMRERARDKGLIWAEEMMKF